MSNEKQSSSHKKAKKMMIDGESFSTIRKNTHLRLKDLRRIQINEIDPKF